MPAITIRKSLVCPAEDMTPGQLGTCTSSPRIGCLILRTDAGCVALATGTVLSTHSMSVTPLPVGAEVLLTQEAVEEEEEE